MIKMTNCSENTKAKEQIKNKKLVPDDFYRQLKVFLDQDEFDIFKTKSKKKLDKKIEYTDAKIQKLLDLKLRSSKAIKNNVELKKNLKSENLKLKDSLIEQLKLEVA